MAAQIDEFILGTTGGEVRYTVKETNPSTGVVAAKNISAATTLRYFLTNPQGEIIEKTATFYTDGTDGILTYAWVAADLPRSRKDLCGTWKVQPHFTLSGFTGPVDSGQFRVVDCDRKN